MLWFCVCWHLDRKKDVRIELKFRNTLLNSTVVVVHINSSFLGHDGCRKE